MSDIAAPPASLVLQDPARPVKIRLARRGDLSAVLRIERSSFTTPWPESALAAEIGERSWSRVEAAFCEEELVGFMVYWTVVDELHLLNLAVDPRWRRLGVGAALIRHLVDRAQQENRREILLEVRASNHAARRLYNRFGFVTLDVRRGYYSDSGEDALVMGLGLKQIGSGETPGK